MIFIGRKVSRGITVLLFIAFLMMPCWVKDHSVEAKKASEKKEKNKLGNVLIVYYTFSGNTGLVAETIKKKTGGELIKIEPVENYYRADLEEYAKKQVDEGYKTKIKNNPIDITAYDTIFIGSPIWWFTFAPPVHTFLSEYDFKGKRVAPFCTQISAYGSFFSDVEKACPGAKVLPGRDFRSAEISDMKKVNAKIDAWLKELQ